METIGTDWHQHCRLSTLDKRTPLLGGQLYLVVAWALGFNGGVERLFIQTDRGAFYCANEIRLLGCDNTRPLPDYLQTDEPHA